jgi:hypothetical protein
MLAYLHTFLYFRFYTSEILYVKSILTMLCVFIPALLSYGMGTDDEKSYYYFFLSEPTPHNNPDGKETILYTEIMNVTAEEIFFKEKGAEWMQKVVRICENKNGCSSDVYFYSAFADADAEQKRISQRYGNASLYVMKQVKF